jgi:hypothetical protein
VEPITFEDIRPLFRLHIDDAPVKEFLKRFPDHRITKPNDGSQYAIFRPLGFDMLFRPPAGPRGGPSKKLRVVMNVFLFRAGEEKHQEFPEPPFGVKFTDSHDVLIQKLGEPFATSLEMNVTPLAWEKWRVGDGDLTIHAMYDRSNMTTRTFSVGPEVVPAVKPIPSRA